MCKTSLSINILNKISKQKNIEIIRLNGGINNLFRTATKLTELLKKYQVYEQEFNPILEFKKSEYHKKFDITSKIKEKATEKGLRALESIGAISMGASDNETLRIEFKGLDPLLSKYRYYYDLDEKKVCEFFKIVNKMGGGYKNQDLFHLLLIYYKAIYNTSQYFASDNKLTKFGITTGYAKKGYFTKAKNMLTQQVKAFNKLFKENFTLIKSEAGVARTGFILNLGNLIRKAAHRPKELKLEKIMEGKKFIKQRDQKSRENSIRSGPTNKYIDPIEFNKRFNKSTSVTWKEFYSNDVEERKRSQIAAATEFWNSPEWEKMCEENE